MAYDSNKKNFFLNEMFPGQFDTNPRIIFWTVIFLIDVAIIFGAAHLLGLPLPGRVGLMLYLVAAFALFCLESWVYNNIKQ